MACACVCYVAGCKMKNMELLAPSNDIKWSLVPAQKAGERCQRMLLLSSWRLMNAFYLFFWFPHPGWFIPFFLFLDRHSLYLQSSTATDVTPGTKTHVGDRRTNRKTHVCNAQHVESHAVNVCAHRKTRRTREHKHGSRGNRRCAICVKVSEFSL